MEMDATGRAALKIRNRNDHSFEGKTVKSGQHVIKTGDNSPSKPSTLIRARKLRGPADVTLDFGKFSEYYWVNLRRLVEMKSFPDGIHKTVPATQFLHCILLFLLVCCPGLLSANPAPAPVLQSPANNALNVDPDGVLTWTWLDDLVANGSFESGMSPGWYISGNPSLWTITTMTSNYFGMGLRFATAYFPLMGPTNLGRLVQDIYIPADATSATLQWSERIHEAVPGHLTGRFRVMLYQGGSLVQVLEDVAASLGFMNWVSRSTNLLAYAGQSLQLVFQADAYSPLAYGQWYADIDGISFVCNHPSRPDFKVLLGKSPTFAPGDEVGTTSALGFSLPLLATNTTYFWKIGSFRDGVTNFSPRFSFKTGTRTLPKLLYLGSSGSAVTLGFTTKTNRSYIIEQRDGLGPSYPWYDLLPLGPGTGGPITVDVPLPWNDQAYWRVRVEP
jgi:hypothetical protein